MKELTNSSLAGSELHKYGIALEVIRERFSWTLDRKLRPLRSRKFCSDFNDTISYIYRENVKIDALMNESKKADLLSEIDKNLRKNVPQKEFKDYFVSNKGWFDIVKLLNVLTQLIRPKIVIETGVGEIGLSSSFFLQALDTNSEGTLYSIDPDRFYSLYGYHVGGGIPDRLRKRHKLIVGGSQAKLEPMLKELGGVDIFMHDGDHRYSTKMFEYETVFKYINKGGLIFSDDTWDSSWDIFVGRHKLNSCSLRYGDNGIFSIART